MKLKFNGFLVLLIVLVAQITFAQERVVSGVVSDNAGLPLPGVSVLVKGTKSGTQTDFDGKFAIKASPSQILIFSYVGMNTQDVKASSASLKVKMVSSAVELEGVVVTALGIKREKKSLGYSTQNVKSDEISKSGRTSVLDALNGKVSGVQITNSGGQAGSGTNVVIRGYASLTGSNQPLYVVDGVPIDNSSEYSNNSAIYGGTPSSNRASDISPDDVASVSVLKGGAATALYGIRASNGVILITTKKGNSGEGLNVELSTSQSTDMPNKFPNLSDKFTTGSNGIWNAATTNNWGPLSNSGALYPVGAHRDLLGTGTIEDIGGQPIITYTDNYKGFFRDGNTARYNIAVSGGGKDNSFYTSISNTAQGGVIPNQEYKRTSFLFSGSQKISDKLEVEAKANYINSSGKYFDGVLIGENLAYFNNNYDVNNPYQDAYGNPTYWHSTIDQPTWSVNKTGEDRQLDRLIANLGFNYKVLPNLSINYKLGVDTYAESRLNHQSIGTKATNANDYMGKLSSTKLFSREFNSDLFIRYDLHLTDDIKVATMVGNNFNQKVFDRLDNTGTSFIVPNLFDIQNTIEKTTSHYSTTQESLGVFGDVTASYKNYLFVTATARNDWHSTLPRAKNNFLYPSLSTSFIYSELMDTKSFYGKLRASYAKTANVPPVAALKDVYYKQDTNYFGNPAFTLGDVQNNPTLKPEDIIQWEVGSELGFLNNKITLDATYYEKKSVDQIVNSPVSNVTGYSSRWFNIGEVVNKGFEATLKLTNLVAIKDLNWSTEFNFTRNKGIVNKVGDGVDRVILGYGNWTNAEIIAEKGLPLGAIYGYTYEHSVAGDLSSPLLVDANGNPSQSAERVVLGNTQPDFILGWNTSFSYQGINAGFTLERKQGGDIINDFGANIAYSGHSAVTDNRYYTSGTSVQGTQNFNGVDENGAAVNVPAKLTKGFYTTTYANVDQNFIEDASWWRLRNIYIGYSVPKKFLKTIKLSGLDFTLSGRNIWLKTNYSGVDPEVNSRGVGSGGAGLIGIDANSIPNTKSIDFSVKIKL